MKIANTFKEFLYVRQIGGFGLVLCFSLSVFFPPQCNAGTIEDCLVESLKYAEDSTTVGQLREQCLEETGEISRIKPLRDSVILGKREASAGSGVDGTKSSKNPNGPTEMILKTSRARKPAYFPHAMHQEKYYCDTCHHGKDASGKFEKYTPQTVIYKCTVCHNSDMPNDKLNGFQLIGHKLCRGCHRNHQDITSAKCSTCHRKGL